MTTAPPRPSAETLLVDARLGLVTRLAAHRPSPRMPESWTGWSARAADSRQFAPWQGERYGFGAALGDHGRARAAALGEAVERYCGNAVPPELEIASHAELTAAGRAALDPTTLALYSHRQYGTRGFPFVPFTRELPVAWVPGRDLHTGAPVLVPASLAYLNYFQGSHAREPATHAMCYAGIATGQDRAHAERFALEELLERDANTIWWASGATARPISDPAELLTHRTTPAVRLLHIPGQLPVPVIGAFIEEPEHGLVAYGTACRADPLQAAKKALVEAFAMLELTAELADPDSPHWRAVARGEVPAHTYRRFRADRCYRDEFRPDYHDLVDLPAVAQLYLDPRMQRRPLDRLREPGPGIRLAALPAVDEHRARQCYLDLLAERGLRAMSVDVTTSDVRAAGLTVVRVIVPGLYGNAPAAFPYLGGRRLYQVPVALGLVDRPLTEDDLYPYPIPHV